MTSVQGKEVHNVELEDMEETEKTEPVDAPNNNVTEVTEDSLKRVADENENRENSERQKTIPDFPGTNQASTSSSYTMHDVKEVGLETLKKVTLIQNILEKHNQWHNEE